MYFTLLNQAFRGNGQITLESSKLDFEASVGPIFHSIVLCCTNIQCFLFMNGIVVGVFYYRRVE